MNTATASPVTDATGGAFDDTGRCIPNALQAPAHARSRRYFRIDTPVFDPAAAHARLLRHLGAGQETSVEAFIHRSEAIRARLQADPQTRGILAGPGIPFILPRGPVTEIGTLLGEGFVPAVGRAYEETYPDYRFTNQVRMDLSGRLSIRPGSRHEQVVDAMERREVVGIYFPCLTEYAIPAAVEQLAGLPEHLTLSGGFDTSAALVAAPGLLLRKDGYPPLLWLSGLKEDDPAAPAYHYEAYGYNLTFNRRPHLNQAAECWWNGITVLDIPPA